MAVCDIHNSFRHLSNIIYARLRAVTPDILIQSPPRTSDC